MAYLVSFNDVKAWVLSRATELSDGTSDFDTSAAIAIVEAWRDLVTRYPWLCLRKNPPGALVTSTPITNLTLTSAAGTSVVGTLSATYPTSLTGFKIMPAGLNYYIRILSHTGGTAAVTLDAVPAALSAVTCTIYQDEYDLASDVGLFVNGLWTRYGGQIVMWDEELLRSTYPNPPSAAGWPPKAFARLSKTRIRFSSYATTAERLEYPYTYEPVDPDASPTTELVIEARLRPVLAMGALATLFDMKLDSRAARSMQLYEDKIEKAWNYESKLHRPSFGTGGTEARPGDYQ